MPLLSVDREVVADPDAWVLLCPESDGEKVYITNRSTDLLLLRFQLAQPTGEDVPDAIVEAGKTWREDVGRYSGNIWGFFLEEGNAAEQATVTLTFALVDGADPLELPAGMIVQTASGVHFTLDATLDMGGTPPFTVAATAILGGTAGNVGAGTIVVVTDGQNAGLSPPDDALEYDDLVTVTNADVASGGTDATPSAAFADVSDFFFIVSGTPGDSGTGSSGLPKHEAEILVPVGGWDLEIQEIGGGDGNDTITIPAGKYYLTSPDGDSLLDVIVELLNASTALAGTYAATVDDDYDGSTGRVTISVSGGGVTAFDIGFSSPALRDALGFSGSPVGEATYTSAYSSPHIWLPDGQRYPGPAPSTWRGVPLAASTVGSAPDGTTSGAKGAERAGTTVEYGQLRANKVWQTYEEVPNESYETFWKTNFPRRFRFHPNRANDDIWLTYRPLHVTDPLIHVEATSAEWTDSEESLWHIGPLEALNQD